MYLPCILLTFQQMSHEARAAEQALLERRRLTGQEPAPYESLPAYKDALKMCQDAVDRNVRARAESGGAATRLSHSQFRVHEASP
jgi:hypothetical protein